MLEVTELFYSEKLDEYVHFLAKKQPTIARELLEVLVYTYCKAWCPA